MWYIYRMEYYLATKKDRILIHATMWMGLDNIMLSARSQSQRSIHCMIPFMWNFQNWQIYIDKVDKRLPGMEGVGERGECLLMGTRFLFRVTGKIWNPLWWWLHNSANTSKSTELGTSLVVQWLRIRLLMQGTRVQSLVRELKSYIPQGN